MMLPGLRRSVAAFALLAAALAGQTPTAPQGEPTSVVIARELEAVQADAGMAPELKTAVGDTLRRALEAARRGEGFKEAAARHAESKTSAPNRLRESQTELEALDRAKPGPARPDAPLAELEQGFAEAQQALAAAQQAVATADQESMRRNERRTAIPARLTVAQERLTALPSTLGDDPGVAMRLRQAQRTALAAERGELQAEIAALQAELQVYDTETELQRALRNLAARRLTAARADVDAWQLPLQAARAAAAQRAEQEARVAQLLADPRLAKLAADNALLATEAARLVGLRDQADGAKLRNATTLGDLQKDFDETRKRTELVGASEAVGALLRQRRTQLVETARRTQTAARSRVGDATEAQFKSLEYDERLQRLVEDPDGWLTAKLAEAGADGDLTPDLLAEARRLREARRELLTQLSNGYENLVETLLDVTAQDAKLATLLAEFRNFVTERVLSIRSSKPLWHYDGKATWDAVRWSTDAEHWAELLRAALPALVDPIWPAILLAGLLALLGLRRRIGASLQQNGEAAARGSTISFKPTALATFETLLLTAPLPALLVVLGAALEHGAASGEFSKAIAAGLQGIGLSLLPVLALQQVVRPKGLAESHFQWQTTTLARLRSILPWLLGTAPFTFAVAVLEAPGDDSWLGSLGASLLAVELSFFAIAFWRLLHPRHGILGAGASATGPLHRFRKLWFVVGVGTPVTLLVMVLLGYEYTALHLTRSIVETFGAVLAAVFVQGLVLRGLLVERRRLQSIRTKELLEAARTGETAAAGAGSEGLDPGTLARQTQTLVRWLVAVAAAVMVFQIWVDVLPALGILRRVDLWSTTDADGTAVAITLANVLASAFVLLLAVAAARNLPALLELLVLQRLRMQSGERHAITTLARYGIMLVGMLYAFGEIGVGWSKVQWLVAAVSVGLGFGLQEIFANFVSGLILLVERPIRVGDVVQIGGTAGKVTKIRIRATTVQDWDRKELVVPNREFVTGQFVNWTLTDGVVRRTIKIGVAYGSDTAKALQLLLECAKRAKVALTEPPPEALFLGFGDSTLDLELRIYVDQTTLDLKDVSALLSDIDQAFRKAAIEIAFPQRDVHLDLSPRTVELLRKHD